MRSVQVMFPLGASGGGGAGALVYKGTVASASDLPASPSVGWVYVATASFTVSSKNVESGDMLIWNGTGWDIVQGNTDPIDIWEAVNATVVYNGSSTNFCFNIYKNNVKQTTGSFSVTLHQYTSNGERVDTTLSNFAYSSLSGFWIGSITGQLNASAQSMEFEFELGTKTVCTCAVLKPANGITSTDDGYVTGKQVYQIVGDIESALASI